MKDITNTNINARSWDDIIVLSEPNSTPLLNTLSGESESIGSTTYEWYEKRNFNTKAKAIVAIASAATTMTVDDITVFAIGQYIAIDDEKVEVTGVNSTTSVVTITRGQLGTVGAAHAIGVDLFVVGTESEEGSAARTPRNAAEVKKENYTEIFKESIEISGSQMKRKLEAKMKSKNISDLPLTDERVIDAKSEIYAELELEKFNEICGQVEKSFNLGTAFVSANGKERKLGGLKYFITSNLVDGAGTAVISSDLFDDFVDNIAETGAFDVEGTAGYIFWVSPLVFKKMKALNLIQIEQMDDGILGTKPVQQISTTQGVFPVKTTRNIGSNDIYFPNMNNIGVKIFREFTTSDWADNGNDAHTSQIIGELTLEVKNEEQMGIIKNLKLS